MILIDDCVTASRLIPITPGFKGIAIGYETDNDSRSLYLTDRFLLLPQSGDSFDSSVSTFRVSGATAFIPPIGR